MKFLSLSALAVSASALSANLNAQEAKPIHIKTEYESLCPYSRMWIIQGLVPAISALDELIDFELIPYGNFRNNQCHHGADECHYNRVHSCAIINSQERFSLSKTNALFVKCSMINCKDDRTDDCWESCTSPETAESIHTCLTNGDAEIFNDEMRDRTGPHDYVPWIFINGKRVERQAFQNELCLALSDYKDEPNVKNYCDNIIPVSVVF